ncbi:MAG: T9SS type A sorting domain-containing protein [Sphingobacteriaceae bacterium]|nr:T9SS type A sorting domain-containing protein [Sphingobacteriaceae bacterium]
MKQLSTILLFLFFTGFAFRSTSQTIYRDANCSAGESLVNGDYSLSFIMGEVVGELYVNDAEKRYLTAGFLQPDIEIKEILDRDISASLVVFPNPTRSGLIKLAFNSIPKGTYQIEIIDALGRVLQTQTVVYNPEDLLYLNMDVSTLAKGMYFIRAKSDNNFKGQVRLIKI